MITRRKVSATADNALKDTVINLAKFRAIHYLFAHSLEAITYALWHQQEGR